MRFRRKFAVGIVAASVFAFGGIALAASSFEDVPDDHVFSQDIAWLAENGITKGRNPPDNTQFCPDDPVTRGQMAAFMHRFATGLDLEGVRGPEGPEGPQGPQGPEGPQGPQGDRGPSDGYAKHLAGEFLPNERQELPGVDDPYIPFTFPVGPGEAYFLTAHAIVDNTEADTPGPAQNSGATCRIAWADSQPDNAEELANAVLPLGNDAGEVAFGTLAMATVVENDSDSSRDVVVRCWRFGSGEFRINAESFTAVQVENAHIEREAYTPPQS
jgi:hypothetical protein